MPSEGVKDGAGKSAAEFFVLAGNGAVTAERIKNTVNGISWQITFFGVRHNHSNNGNAKGYSITKPENTLQLFSASDFQRSLS